MLTIFAAVLPDLVCDGESIANIQKRPKTDGHLVHHDSCPLSRAIPVLRKGRYLR